MSGNVRRNLHPFPSLLQQRHNKSHFSSTPSCSGTRSVWRKLRKKIEVCGRLVRFVFFFPHPFLFSYTSIEYPFCVERRQLCLSVIFCVCLIFSVSTPKIYHLHRLGDQDVDDDDDACRQMPSLLLSPSWSCRACLFISSISFRFFLHFCLNTRVWFPLLTLNCTLLKWESVMMLSISMFTWVWWVDELLSLSF